MNNELKAPVSSVEEMHAKIDAFEEELVKFPPPEDRLIHTFTPGIYSRTIIMPAGSIYTSKIHKTEHPFVVSKGHCTVRNVMTHEMEEIRAPFLGVTKPGTRRVLIIYEETIWTTFHATTETDLEKIEAQLIEPHEHTLKLAQLRGEPQSGLLR